MLTEYIDEALRRARYELIEDEETPYYGKVPDLPGVWACGRTLEGCRRELKEVIEGWILVSVRRSLDLPRLGSAEITEIDADDVLRDGRILESSCSDVDSRRLVDNYVR